MMDPELLNYGLFRLKIGKIIFIFAFHSETQEDMLIEMVTLR